MHRIECELRHQEIIDKLEFIVLAGAPTVVSASECWLRPEHTLRDLAELRAALSKVEDVEAYKSSTFARGLLGAAHTLEHIYSAVYAENFQVALNLLHSEIERSSRDHWCTLLT